jgi:hypothetical protein
MRAFDPLTLAALHTSIGVEQRMPARQVRVRSLQYASQFAENEP